VARRGACFYKSDGIEIIGLAWGLVRVGIGLLVHRFSRHPDGHGSHNMAAARRRVPLIAAVPKIFFPFLVILPGLLAIGLPTTAYNNSGTQHQRA